MQNKMEAVAAMFDYSHQNEGGNQTDSAAVAGSVERVVGGAGQ